MGFGTQTPPVRMDLWLKQGADLVQTLQAPLDGPQDFTGKTARLGIRSRFGGPVLVYITTTSGSAGSIVLNSAVGDTAATVTITITKAAAAAVNQANTLFDCFVDTVATGASVCIFQGYCHREQAVTP